ncbi:TPA: YadA-like family protein [Pasteurella multocida]|nr:YadA-like family protein [Pasteurella multocida]
MNKIYKVIWNYTLNTFVVVSELAKGCVKSSSSNTSSPSKFSRAFKLTLLSLLLGVSLPSPAYIAIGSVENNSLNSNGADAQAPHSDRGTLPLDYKNPGNKSYDNSKDASINANYSSNKSFGIAIGNHSSAIVSRGDRRSNGIAIGDYSQATGGLSMALGAFAKATHTGGVAIGAASLAQGFNSLSMMRQSAAIGNYSTAIGSVSWANGTASFALGASATAFGDQSIAIGSVSPKTLSSSDPRSANKTQYDGFNRTQTNGNNSIAMGSAARTNGDNSFAIGSGAETGSFDEKQDSYLNDKVREANSGKRAEGAIAFGVQAKAKEAKAMAFGYAAQALKENAMAFGAQANASESNAMAFGSQANALKQNAMAFGSQANASQENAMAFGASSKALAGSAMAFGTNAEAKQNNAIAFGAQAKATEIQAIAIGFSANATQSSAVAIGSQTNALKDNTTAIGTTSKATQSNSTALGFGAQATHENSVALGANSQTEDKVATPNYQINGVNHQFAGNNPIGTVSIGDTNKHRTITNVAAGRISDSSTDAINGSQLHAVITEVNKGWNITTAADGGEVIGNTPAKVKLGDTVTVKAGKNIKITQADKNITVATKEDVTFNKVDTQTLNVKGDTTVKNFTVDPNSNINMGNNRIMNVSAPTADTDAVNKKYVDQGRTIVTSQDSSVTINTTTANNGATTYDLKVNANFNYSGDNGSKGSNKLSSETAFKGTSNEIVTSATNGQITFGLHQEAKNALNLAKTAIQNFTVGAGTTTPKISVDNTEKHFDIVGSENYVTTQVEGRNIKIGLGDKAKNAIDNVTSKTITVTGGTSQANQFTVAEGGSIKVIAKPNDPLNLIDIAADATNKAITVGINKTNFDNAVTNNTQVQANKNKLAELEPKVNENKQNIAALDTKVTENKNEINNLKPQVTANKTEIDKLKPKVEENANNLNTLNTTVQTGWELTINNDEKVKDVTPTDRKANFKSGDNIVITKENNSVKIATSLTPKFTNATFGDNGDKTVINKDGITISNTNPDKSVSLTDSGLDNGGNKIQNIANGTSPNDAVNMSQLDAVNATANAGWKLQVNKKSDTESKVTPNTTVSLNNDDGNIHIAKSQNDNNVSFALNTDLVLGKEDPAGKDGSLTVKGKDGSSVVLNGKDGSIGLTGTAGADGSKPQTMIKVTKGQPDVNNTGSKNRITYTNGNNNSTEELATLNDGLKFKGDNDPVIKKKLNEQLEIIGGANKDKLSSNNIGVNENNGKLEIKLSKELSDLVSAEFGTGKDKTTINKDGITITNGDKNVSLTENGLNNGGNKISNIANGVDDSDAVNMSQLNAVNATANAGWTLFTNNNDATKSIIRPNSTVSLNNQDGNIQITKTANDGNVTFALSPTLNLGSNDPNGNDGLLTVKGKDGSSVALNGKDGSISLTGPTEINGTDKPTTNIKVKNGSGDVNSPDKKTRITYTNGKNGSEEEVATLNDGLKFKGDTGTEIVKKLNETVTIKGNMVEADEVTDKNLRVDNNNGSLILKMAKSLKELANATFGADGDKTFINKDGISITNNGNTISLTDNGLNNGDKQITNVASGLGANTKLSDINDSDNKLKNAANIGDLKNAITDVVSGGFGLKDDNAQEVKQSLGTSIKVQGDGSITTKVVDKNGDKALQVGLTNSVTVGDTTQPGTVTVRGENGADSITLNGKDGTIGLKGKDGASANITVTNGPSTLDGPKNTTNTPRISYNNGNTKEYLATTNDGLIFGANDGAEHKAKLNTKVDIKGDAANTNWNEFDQGKNLMTNMDNGTIRIGLAKDLTALNSATFTETTNPAAKSVVNGKGLTITPADNNKQTVSLTDAGLNNGGNKITNVGSGLGTQSLENASGDTLTNAVNVQDLKNAITKTVGESGWNLQTNNDTPTKVGHNNTVQFINGENIVITRNAGSRDITISTAKDLNVDSIKAGKNGNNGVDGKITAEGKNGSSVALNGADGSIGVSNKGANGAAANITVKQGNPDVNGQPNTTKTRITYQPTDQNGTPQGDVEEVATLKDGLKFKGDKGTEIVKQLNQTLTIKGNVIDTAEVTDKNLRVDNDNGSLILKMAKSLQDLHDITFGDKNGTDKVAIDKDGITITNNGNTVKLTENGLDNGGHQITNVDSGLLNKANGSSVALKDAADDMLKNAANIGDLKNAITDLTGTDKGGFGLKDDAGQEFKEELGKTAQIKGDGSIVTKIVDVGNNGKKALQVGLNKDITVGDTTNPGSIKIKGPNNKDAIALNGQDGTIKLKGAKGDDRIALNGNDGSIGLTGEDGTNGTLTFAKGKSHIDGVEGAQETPRISYKSNNGTPEYVATLNDGLKFGANTGNVHNAKLNSRIDVKGDAKNNDWNKFDAGKNIMTNIVGSTITVGLAKALTDLESVTFNKGKNGAAPTATTSINSSGLTITPNNNNNQPNKTVSLTDNGLNNGGNTITNVASGLNNKNLSDLKDDSSELNNAANVGDLRKALSNLTDNGFGLKDEKGNTFKQKLGETAQVKGDGSIFTKVIDSDNGTKALQVGLNKDITVGNATDPGTVTVKGPGDKDTIKLDGASGKISVKADNGKDAVSLNKDGSIGINGKDGASSKLTVKNGKPGVDGQDGTTKTRVTYQPLDENGQPKGDAEEVATLNDGLIFVGNDGKKVIRKLNSTLNIIGGITKADELIDATKVSSNNLGVRWKSDDSLEIVMKERPTFSGLVLNGKDGQPAKIEFKGENDAPGMSISGSNGNNGDPSLVIKNKDGQDGVTFTNDGRITNVENGTGDKDAVNLGQLNKVKDDLVKKGFGIKAEDGKSVNKSLGDTVDIIGDGTNISTKVDGDKVKIELAKTINLGDDGSVTAGKTVLNKDGVKVGDKVALTEEGLKVGDKVKVTESGLKVGDKVNITEAGVQVGDVNITDAGINAGNKKVTNVANGDISANSTDAVNGSQLFKEAAKSKTEVEAGENIVVTSKDGDNGQKIYTVATKKEVAFDSVKVGDISINKNDGINAGNKKISNVADGKIGEGSKDAVNGHQLFTEAAKAKSEVVKGTNIASVDTSKGDKGQTIYTVNADGASVSAGSDKVTVTKGTKDANNVTDYKVDLAKATKDDIAKGVDAKTQVDKGINFAGGDGKSKNYKLGDTITIAGDENLTTETTDKGVTVKLNKDVNLNSVSANTFKAGGVTISADSGINAGGKQITHVASGLVDKNGNKVHIRNASGDTLNNAVNVGDLKSVAGDIYNNIDTTNKRVDKLDKRVRGIGANSAAAASLPQVYIPGKSMVAASAGGYGGEAAVALGYSRASDNGKVILKLTGTANSAGHYSGGVGVGYQW